MEELRPEPPSFDDLSDDQRVVARRFVDSLEAARGIDPYASRPSIEELTATADPTAIENSTIEVAEWLEARLQASIAGAMVVTDLASVAAGLASVLVIFGGGLRIRVLIAPEGTNLDAAYPTQVEGIAALFGAYPDTHGVLFMTAGTDPIGVIIDRTDVEAAIETPSGHPRPPRIRRPLDHPETAVRQFHSEAMPVFSPFDATFASQSADRSTFDSTTIAAQAVFAIVDAGQRARIDAKRSALTALGDVEIAGLAALLDESQGELSDDAYGDRIDAIVETAA